MLDFDSAYAMLEGCDSLQAVSKVLDANNVLHTDSKTIVSLTQSKIKVIGTHSSPILREGGRNKRLVS